MTDEAARPTHVMVTTTTAERANAEAIASRLLGERLAACVQILPIESRYVWEGRIERGTELLLLIKARADDYPLIERAIRDVHAYEVPQITAVALDAGSAAYLSWIDEVTTRRPAAG